MANSSKGFSPAARDVIVEILREANPTTVVVETPEGLETYATAGNGVCDFCNGPGPFSAMPCGKVVVEAPFGINLGSTDDWAACAPCKVLIDAADRDGLAERSAVIFSKKYPLPKPMAKAAVSVMHNAFWDNRQK
jgi:hypothetical protein